MRASGDLYATANTRAAMQKRPLNTPDYDCADGEAVLLTFVAALLRIAPSLAKGRADARGDAEADGSAT